MSFKNKLFVVILLSLILAGCAMAVLKWAEEEGVTREPDRLCKDRCGDGICQEIVCLGTGCPCAETIDNCPEDCK